MATQAFTQLVQAGFSRFGFIWFGQAISFTPLAYLLAGPVADRVAEPFVRSPDGGADGRDRAGARDGFVVEFYGNDRRLIPAIRNGEEG